VEGAQGVGRSAVHDPRKCLEGIFVRDLRVRPRKWSEALVVFHEDFVIVVLMVDRHIRLHDVEATAVDSVDELQRISVNRFLSCPQLWERTVTPKDQISVAVVQGSCI
jgi:hypothetical protein